MGVFPKSYALLCAGLMLIFLPGCSAVFYNPDKSTVFFLDTYNIKQPTSPYDFASCNHYDCDGGGARVYFSTKEWQGIQLLFIPPAITASEERRRIAKAVALMEARIGQKNNTFADQACNNFKAPVESYQHDCVAETVNSTIYLLLLEKEQLLRWHQVSYPAQRSVAAILFPHYSAVIKEIENNDLYVVDSWFFANGEKPVIIPLAQWRKNYYPKPCS